MTNHENFLNNTFKNFPRILSGKWKGRRLDISLNAKVRPTLARHRLRLFDWLMPFLPNARVLDLFAGSGSLGFEALSRGAIYAEFVENNSSQALILERFQKTVQANSKIFAQKVSDYFIRKNPQLFNIVFIDPPFDQEHLLELTVKGLIEKKHLSKDALIYCETPHSYIMSPFLEKNFFVFKEKSLGNVTMKLYQQLS